MFLLNAGGNILLNAGGELLMNDDSCVAPPTPTEGAMSGGKRRKQVGKQLTQGDLGPRPSLVSSGESVSRIKIKGVGESKAKTKLSFAGESLARLIPHLTGESIAKVVTKHVNESKSYLYFKHTNESFGIPHPSIQMGRQIRLQKLSILKEISEKIMSLQKPSIYREFSFNETIHNEQLIAFTHSSSFIGNVRYNTETLEMRILLNGKAYNFCNVPRRVYDAFEGAGSKGAFFARNIRTLYDC